MRQARVFIVEDELLVRTGIKMSCDWNAMDMAICGEADDGLIAWEKFVSLAPDIILLDIRIPGIDGIELLRRIRSVDLDCRIIIISNLQDFSYLHEAMELDITDYIVKLSITGEKITQALEKARGELKALYPETGAPYKADTEEMEFPARWELALFTQPLAAINEVMQNVLIELCAKTLDRFGKLSVVPVAGRGILCLFDRNPRHNSAFLNSLRHIRRYFYRLFSLDLYIFGDEIKADERYEDTYHRMIKQYEKGYWNPEEFIFLDARHAKRGAADVFAERIHENALKTNLAAHEIESFLKQAAVLKKASTPEEWQNALILMAEHAIRHLSSNRRIDQLTRDILDAKNAYAALEVVLSVYRENQCRLVASDRLRPEIQKALAFIDHHYMEDISLKNIARHIMLNANYFSNLFVQETGMNFSSYLMRYRIERAKQQMRDETLTCDQLAQLCGLGSSSQFCRTFKQITGLKPSEYKHRQYSENG